MNIFVLALLLPFVACEEDQHQPESRDYGDCPPPPEDPVTCLPNELMCGGEPDYFGCPVPFWCFAVDPYEHCSARTFCPMMCNDGMWCDGGMDYDGCPMPAFCMPWPSYDDVCPQWSCPVTCGPNQILCGGELGYNDCPMPYWCMDTDYTAICQPSCPITCPYDTFFCSGGLDYNGCEMPATCAPWGDGCPTDDGSIWGWGREDGGYGTTDGYGGDGYGTTDGYGDDGYGTTDGGYGTTWGWAREEKEENNELENE